MPPTSAAAKDLYSALLKKVVDFVERLYGLTTTGPTDSMPDPPPNVSPARHFASYLALSGVTCWLYDAPDRDDPTKITTLFVTKPQKSETVGCFRCFPAKEWMKDAPELTKLYAKALRDDHCWIRQRKINPIVWNQQTTSNAKMGYMLKLAGEFAAQQEIFLKAPTAFAAPDLTGFDLFAAYGVAPTSFGVTPSQSFDVSS